MHKFFEFINSYLWIVAIIPKQLEVYSRSTCLNLEVFPLHFCHGLRSSSLKLGSLIHLNFEQSMRQGYSFFICRYSIFPNIFLWRGYLFSNVSLLYLCQKWDGYICVFVSGSFIQLFWFAWIFCAGTMLFCYYNSVVYLKSSMAIFPALFFLGSFDNSEAFAFSIWVLLFFSNYMKKDIGILMGILLNLYILLTV